MKLRYRLGSAEGPLRIGPSLIGREGADGVQLAIPHEDAPERYAVLMIDPRGLVYISPMPKRPVWINDEPIEGRHRIDGDDRVELGPFEERRLRLEILLEASPDDLPEPKNSEPPGPLWVKRRPGSGLIKVQTITPEPLVLEQSSGVERYDSRPSSAIASMPMESPDEEAVEADEDEPEETIEQPMDAGAQAAADDDEDHSLAELDVDMGEIQRDEVARIDAAIGQEARSRPPTEAERRLERAMLEQMRRRLDPDGARRFLQMARARVFRGYLPAILSAAGLEPLAARLIAGEIEPGSLRLLETVRESASRVGGQAAEDITSAYASLRSELDPVRFAHALAAASLPETSPARADEGTFVSPDLVMARLVATLAEERLQAEDLVFILGAS